MTAAQIPILLSVDLTALLFLFVAWYKGGEQVEMAGKHIGATVMLMCLNSIIILRVFMDIASDIVLPDLQWFNFFSLLIKRLVFLGYGIIIALFYWGNKFNFLIPIYNATGKLFYKFIKKVLYG